MRVAGSIQLELWHAWMGESTVFMHGKHCKSTYEALQKVQKQELSLGTPMHPDKLYWQYRMLYCSGRDRCTELTSLSQTFSFNFHTEE